MIKTDAETSLSADKGRFSMTDKFKFDYQMQNLISIFLTIIFFSFSNSIYAQVSIEELDKSAVFSFSIMSDNKGYSVENPHMYK